MWPWVFLLLATMCEMSWPIGLKLSNNFTRLWPTVGTVLVMLLSFYFLSLASAGKNGIPVGTAYAIWTGVGAAGVAIIGMTWLHEPRDWQRLVCIGVILAGVAGLKMWTPAAPG